MWNNCIRQSILTLIFCFVLLFFTPSSKVSLSIQSSCFDLNLFTQPSLFNSPQNITEQHHHHCMHLLQMSSSAWLAPSRLQKSTLNTGQKQAGVMTLQNYQPLFKWKSLSAAFKGSACGLGVDLFKLFAISAFGNRVAYYVCLFQTRGKGQISFSWT